MLSCVGCQHIAENFQVRESDKMVMHAWVLGTKFKNKRKNSTIPGKTKVYLLGEDKLRMDVYDPFGLVTMGHLVLNGDYMSLETINGVSYKGLATKEKIEQLLQIKVSHKDLFALFRQSGIDEEVWACAVSGDYNRYSNCQSSMYQTEIIWTGVMTHKNTKLILSHQKADLVFRVKSYGTVSDPKESIFKL